MYLTYLAANRNRIARENWSVVQVEKEELEQFPKTFCGHFDLDTFFHKECIPFEEGLFVKTYKLIDLENPDTVIAIASLCNHTITFEYEQRNTHIPDEKFGLESYPAVKIERFAVQKQFQKLGYGTIDFLRN